MSLKIIFMGTPEFAQKSLQYIYEAGHEVVLAVSQPDKPKGRGMKLVPTPVKEYALQKGIEVFQPEKIRTEEVYEKLKSYDADVFVVTAYGRILPKNILELPKRGCINVHASLLPKYRGPAPIQWPIINGDKTTGVTTMYMDEGLDTGDMLLKKEVEIDEDDTFVTLHHKLAIAGGEAIVETLNKLEAGTITREKQDESQATYTKLINKKDGLIDWTKSAEEIKNLVRGFNPWPGAFTTCDYKLLKLWNVEIVEANQKAPPGTVIKCSCKDGIVVITGNGALKIIDIQTENCKKMNCSEYLAGHPNLTGITFGTKAEIL